MTISNPDHWKEPYFSGKTSSPKYNKIVEMIAQINANIGGVPGAHSTTHEVGGGDLVDHNSLTNYAAARHYTEGEMSLANLGTRNHASLFDAPTDAHHPQDHDNTYHTTNYETANTNIQSHVASPAADAHHTESHDFDTHSGDVDLTDLGSYLEDALIVGGVADWETLAIGSTNGYVLQRASGHLAWGVVPSHSQSGSTIDSGDVGIEFLDEILHDFICYGSDNTAKIACMSEMGTYYAATNFTANENGFSNGGGTDYSHYFAMPLPCILGTKKLYITAIRIYAAGDASDYITATYLRGYNGATRTTVETDTTDVGESGSEDRTWTFGAARDCSSYDWMRVRFEIVATTRDDLYYSAPVITYYYA